MGGVAKENETLRPLDLDYNSRTQDPEVIGESSDKQTGMELEVEESYPECQNTNFKILRHMIPGPRPLANCPQPL